MDRYKIYVGDAKALIPNTFLPPIHAIVTDPPYHMESTVSRFSKPDSAPPKGGVYNRTAKNFIGEDWDAGNIAFDPAFWILCKEKMVPGGHLLAFSSTKRYHKLCDALEKAGFEIRDQIGWLYGTGFPKRKEFLKPAWEPIVVARSPMEYSTAKENVKIHGTGILNIEAASKFHNRYPANLITDGSIDDVHAEYFYCAKPSKSEKFGDHPTQKPLTLMRYLVNLVRPFHVDNPVILDPFSGSGTTLHAAIIEGFDAYGFDKSKKYVHNMHERLEHVTETTDGIYRRETTCDGWRIGKYER
jgi:DNA modification methylase